MAGNWADERDNLSAESKHDRQGRLMRAVMEDRDEKEGEQLFNQRRDDFMRAARKVPSDMCADSDAGCMVPPS